VRDDAAAHEIDKDRGETGLHHVSAEHGDNSALAPRGHHHRSDDTTEVAGGQDIGKGSEKSAEGPVVRRRMRELGGADLVWSSRNGNGANRAEISLGRAFGR
jgi:hypothetical protein